LPGLDTLVVIIESSPANLDPRVGTDAQSERIGKLLFDSLLRRDEHFDVQPSLAMSWEIPDPRTYIFHLRSGVRFSDGRPLEARDVKWTFDSVLNGSIRTPKATAYSSVEGVEIPNRTTVVFHLRQPDAEFLWNVSEGAMGIVPYGSGAGFNRVLVGSGPFRLVRSEEDQEVVLARNDLYWGEKPRIERVRFAVVPDAITRALELRKGSADVAVNALTADMILAMRNASAGSGAPSKPDSGLVGWEPDFGLLGWRSEAGALQIRTSPGTIYAYLAMNLRDPILRDVRVRRALAYAIDRQAIIHYLWRDLAQPAYSVLPPEQWAYEGNVQRYAYDPRRARQLLDSAGYPERNGVRFHLSMKTSTEEDSRLLAAVLQQQLQGVGIALDIRSFEFATFYADVTKGAFQLCSLRWIGGNEYPDIFEHVFYSSNVPPHGANRGFYANPRVDRLIDEARESVDREPRRRLYAEIQQILAEDLPYINLWYLDNVVVHTSRVRNLTLSPSGDYNFLIRAELHP
jgi:peptide/nickel transport system substrate-binding protein